jgi:hypothetical protein
VAGVEDTAGGLVFGAFDDEGEHFRLWEELVKEGKVFEGEEVGVAMDGAVATDDGGGGLGDSVAEGFDLGWGECPGGSELVIAGDFEEVADFDAVGVAGTEEEAAGFEAAPGLGAEGGIQLGEDGEEGSGGVVDGLREAVEFPGEHVLFRLYQVVGGKFNHGGHGGARRII